MWDAAVVERGIWGLWGRGQKATELGQVGSKQLHG